ETVRAGHLAARFAAKEATFKLLGAGDELPPWRSIEVVREDSGRTSLRLYGRAEELALAAGVSELAVSLTHEGPIAAAVIVAREGEAMW
ncbi:MAG: holo-ACP synthase, partial [Acidimicrobiales bacterium]